MVDIREEIKKLNEEITRRLEFVNYLINNVDEIVAVKEKEAEKAKIDDPLNVLVSAPNKYAILRKANYEKATVMSLKKKRNNLIDKLVRSATFSHQDMINILGEFGYDYKSLVVGQNKMLVPVELVLTKGTTTVEDLMQAKEAKNKGANSQSLVFTEYQEQTTYDLYHTMVTNRAVRREKEAEKLSFGELVKQKWNLLKSKLGFKKDNAVQVMGNPNVICLDESVSEEVNYDLKLNSTPLTKQEIDALKAEYIEKGYDVDALKVKKAATTIKPNEYISSLATVIETTGDVVQVFNYDGDSVSLDSKVVEVIPPEVLAFLQGYAVAKCNDEALSIKDYYAFVKHEYKDASLNDLLGFSYFARSEDDINVLKELLQDYDSAKMKDESLTLRDYLTGKGVGRVRK